MSAPDGELKRALALLVRWKAAQLGRNARGEGCPQGVFEETGELLAEYGMDIRLRQATELEGKDA